MKQKNKDLIDKIISTGCVPSSCEEFTHEEIIQIENITYTRNDSYAKKFIKTILEMTQQENEQRIKNETLNSIRKIYNPRIKTHHYSNYFKKDSEQRDNKIRQIIGKMEKELSDV